MIRCILVMSVVACVGCGKSAPEIVPVEGVVLLNGEPLPEAEVQFVPMSPGLGAEYIAVATTDERGRFSLACRGRPGACVGENRVTVSDAPAPAELRGLSRDAQTRTSFYYRNLKNRPIPAIYGNVAQSPLVVVVEAGRGEYRLEMKR